LLANGRFLAEKFGTSSLEIDEGLAKEGVAVPTAEQTAAERAREEERVSERERVH
jgi:hypothetical protein